MLAAHLGRADVERRAVVHECGGGAVFELCAGEGFWPFAAIDGMAAAGLHAFQFLPALVEFVIADGGDGEAHLRERFDSGLVVEEELGPADDADGDVDAAALTARELADERSRLLLEADRGDGDGSRAVHAGMDGQIARISQPRRSATRGNRPQKAAGPT